MIIIARKVGQLGNLLLLSANAMACAIENNRKVAIPAFGVYSQYFRGTAKNILCRYPAQSSVLGASSLLRTLLYWSIYLPIRLMISLGMINFPLAIRRIKIDQEFDLAGEEFVDLLKKRRAVFLLGWNFRDPEAIRRHADVIREHFRPLQTHEHNVAKIVDQARQGGDLLVGVHIRHADYNKFQGGKYYYTTDQYVKLMRQMEKLMAPTKVSFLVCSDDDLHQNDFDGLAANFSSGHLVEDMYALAGCDFILGPPSTYTTWASFYGKTPLGMVKSADQQLDLDHFTIAWGG